MSKEKKFIMRMSLNVLNHLGMNLYSNIPAVLSEVVANAYDADATKVDINIGGNEITITDNGNGMCVDDINDKFLYVGYQRREAGEGLSEVLKRPVMGRKGIGKLSLFSIASEIIIHTIKKNKKKASFEKSGFVLRKKDIIRQITGSKDGEYYPDELAGNTFDIKKGTRITIRDFKKNINHTESYLRKRLAKRFSIIGSKHNFNVSINKDPIGVQDRDYIKKVQFLWVVGKDHEGIAKAAKFKRVNHLNGDLDNGKGFKISGWIGAVNEAGDLDIDGVNNNKISILCRGKMAQEDILESFNEGGIYSTYLIGEIEADFLDLDTEDDIATTSRQKINEEDERYLELQKHVYKLLKEIQKVWTELRKEVAESEAIERAEKFSPVLKQWFDSLKTPGRQAHAKKLFATIETMHFVKEEAYEKKKELYKQGIIAFEKLNLRDRLHELEKVTGPDDLKLSMVFNDLSDIEANLYYDIASERVAVIREFQRKLDVNDKEKLLQKYLFNNLWLLNPSWERATQGTEVMESRVEKAFAAVTKSLTAEERKGRLDIKYRTSAGKHIVVELKRYTATYKITKFTLAEQAEKYRNALAKVLATIDKEHEAIEVIIVLGQKLGATPKEEKEVQEILKPVNARVIYYDFLIDQSLEAYGTYLDKQKEVSRIRAIIEKL